MLLTPCLLKLPENLNNNSKQMFVDIDYIEAAHFKYRSPRSSQPQLFHKDRYFSNNPTDRNECCLSFQVAIALPVTKLIRLATI